MAESSRSSLEDNGVVEEWGNVRPYPPGGGRLAEWMGKMNRSGELDPGGAHDTGRSSEEDPG